MLKPTDTQSFPVRSLPDHKRPPQNRSLFKALFIDRKPTDWQGPSLLSLSPSLSLSLRLFLAASLSFPLSETWRGDNVCLIPPDTTCLDCILGLLYLMLQLVYVTIGWGGGRVGHVGAVGLLLSVKKGSLPSKRETECCCVRGNLFQHNFLIYYQ